MGALLSQKVVLRWWAQEQGAVELVMVTQDGNERTFIYRPRETLAGTRWFSEVQRTTSARLPIKDPWRVYNAPGGSTGAELRAKFAECCATINFHRPGTLPAGLLGKGDEQEMGFQERLNYAHTFFETMMGSADEPVAFYRDASVPLRHEIEKYNLLVHALEDDHRQAERRAEGKHLDVRVVVTFLGRRRVPLELEELEGFRIPRDFGVAYLNYCMVGKHLLEACDDEDTVTGVLRPQTHRSADTLLWFGPSMTAMEHATIEYKVSTWWRREGIDCRFKRHDSTSAIGYLPVADLCCEEGDARGRDQMSIVALLGGTTIKSFRAR